MSKGFGVFGGTVAGSKDLIEFCANKSRTYLLSTAHPPGIVAANIASIEVVESEPQDETLASYAPKLTPEIARINWGDPAETIARQVRALDPRVGARTRTRGG